MTPHTQQTPHHKLCKYFKSEVMAYQHADHVFVKLTTYVFSLMGLEFKIPISMINRICDDPNPTPFSNYSPVC